MNEQCLYLILRYIPLPYLLNTCSLVNVFWRKCVHNFVFEGSAVCLQGSTEWIRNLLLPIQSKVLRDDDNDKVMLLSSQVARFVLRWKPCQVKEESSSLSSRQIDMYFGSALVTAEREGKRLVAKEVTSAMSKEWLVSLIGVCNEMESSVRGVILHDLVIVEDSTFAATAFIVSGYKIEGEWKKSRLSALLPRFALRVDSRMEDFLKPFDYLDCRYSFAECSIYLGNKCIAKCQVEKRQKSRNEQAEPHCITTIDEKRLQRVARALNCSRGAALLVLRVLALPEVADCFKRE